MIFGIRLLAILSLLYISVSCKKGNITTEADSNDLPVMQNKKCFISKLNTYVFEQAHDTLLERGFYLDDSIFTPHLQFIYKNGKLQREHIKPDLTKKFREYFYTDSTLSIKTYINGKTYSLLEFYFDKNGFLVEEKHYSQGIKHPDYIREHCRHFPDSSGNVVETHILLSKDPAGLQGNFMGVIKYRYDKYENYNKYLPYITNKSFNRNNIVELSYYNWTGNKEGDTEVFKYEYNTEGLPVKRISSTITDNFTYSCNN